MSLRKSKCWYSSNWHFLKPAVLLDHFRLTPNPTPHTPVKVLICIEMLFIFSIPVIIRHLWQLMTVFLHCCIVCMVLLVDLSLALKYSIRLKIFSSEKRSSWFWWSIANSDKSFITMTTDYFGIDLVKLFWHKFTHSFL